MRTIQVGECENGWAIHEYNGGFVADGFRNEEEAIRWAIINLYPDNCRPILYSDGRMAIAQWGNDPLPLIVGHVINRENCALMSRSYGLPTVDIYDSTTGNYRAVQCHNWASAYRTMRSVHKIYNPAIRSPFLS